MDISRRKTKPSCQSWVHSFGERAIHQVAAGTATCACQVTAEVMVVIIRATTIACAEAGGIMRAMEAAADAGLKLWLVMKARSVQQAFGRPAQGAADSRLSSHTL
jgi:hypothetical protein